MKHVRTMKAIRVLWIVWGCISGALVALGVIHDRTWNAILVSFGGFMVLVLAALVVETRPKRRLPRSRSAARTGLKSWIRDEDGYPVDAATPTDEPEEGDA